LNAHVTKEKFKSSCFEKGTRQEVHYEESTGEEDHREEDNEEGNRQEGCR
jgi:hypothetical protein